MGVKNDNAWCRIVELFDRSHVELTVTQATRRIEGLPAKTDWRDHPDLAVSLLDRPSPRTIAVSWRDPLSCHYGHQAWRASVAARSGKCVLSGQPIRRGDLIYRPEASQPPPANEGAMMIASYADVALVRNAEH
jgi:hypothetical protein